MLDDEERRLECLRLAQIGANANSTWADPGEVVARARLYHDFVRGTNDAEIVGAARELAKRVNH
jgi:hypothetical protein